MLNPSELKKIDAYWRASNYLAAGQLYLLDNPMLRRPLTRDDVKKKIVGHWGTVPGQNFVYVHLHYLLPLFCKLQAVAIVPPITARHSQTNIQFAALGYHKSNLASCTFS